MKRPWLLAFAVCLALSACKQKTETAADALPVKETVGGAALIDYDSPKGAFACRAPAEWKIREDSSSGTDSTTFIGPLSGGRLAFVSILQYPHGPDDPWKDARKYAESFWEITPDNKQPPLEIQKIGGRDAIRFHFEKPFRKPHSKKIEYMLRLDYALIPVKGGFFELWHSAPADRHQETLPVFEAVVRSFKPKI